LEGVSFIHNTENFSKLEDGRGGREHGQRKGGREMILRPQTLSFRSTSRQSDGETKQSDLQQRSIRGETRRGGRGQDQLCFALHGISSPTDRPPLVRPARGAHGVGSAAGGWSPGAETSIRNTSRIPIATPDASRRSTPLPPTAGRRESRKGKEGGETEGVEIVRHAVADQSLSIRIFVTGRREEMEDGSQIGDHGGDRVCGVPEETDDLAVREDLEESSDPESEGRILGDKDPLSRRILSHAGPCEDCLRIEMPLDALSVILEELCLRSRRQ
jgi:hypothetical protein